MSKYQPGQTVTIDDADTAPVKTGIIGNAYNTLRRLIPDGETWYSVKVSGAEVMRPESSLSYAQ